MIWWPGAPGAWTWTRQGRDLKIGTKKCRKTNGHNFAPNIICFALEIPYDPEFGGPGARRATRAGGHLKNTSKECRKKNGHSFGLKTIRFDSNSIR